MKRVFGSLVALSLALWGASEKVEIHSKQFDSDAIKGQSIFTGDVTVTKKRDTLKADQAVVTTDKKNTPTKFEFTGKPVTFFIVQESNKSYRGSANNVVYFPQTKEYVLTDNAYVEYIEDAKTVYGDRIMINQNEQKAKVYGTGEKPARFIFTIDEKESK